MASLNYLLCLGLLAAITVEAKSASTVEKSKVELSVSKVNIPVGQSLFVDCNPGGTVLPTIRWTKNGGDLSKRTVTSGNTISFVDATKEEAGEYLCLGMVGREMVAQQHLTVEIDEKTPTVKVSLKELEVPSGQSATVDCNASGTPPPVVQWSKANGKFSARVKQNTTKLIISDAKESDGGVYVCTAITNGTVAWSDFVTVKILSYVEPATTTVAPAEIKVTPTPEPKVTVIVRKLKIPSGQSGAVECVPEGSPLPAVSWRKVAGSFGKGTRQDKDTLIISNAQKADGGSYVCHGVAAGILVWSEFVQVEIQDAESTEKKDPTSRVELSTTKLEILRGTSGAVDCYPRGSPLPTAVVWSRDNGEFNNRTRVIGNTLVISNAENEDGGYYFCHGVVSSRVVWTDYVQVQIVDEEPAEFDITITDEHNSKIRCELEFEEDNKSSALPTAHAGRELVIRIAPSNSGYHCKVTGHGLSLRAANLQLVAPPLPPPPPPAVIVRPVHATAARGQAVLVECVVVKGRDSARVFWQRVNGSISSHAAVRGSTLFFHAIQVEDAGTYRCIARNAAGEVSETTQITVEEAKTVPGSGSSQHSPIVKIVMNAERVVKIPRGFTGSVYCTPYGVPKPTVQWKPASGRFRDGVTQEGNRLVIYNATYSDSGDYVCDALVESTPVWTDYAQVLVYDRCSETKDSGSTSCSRSSLRWYYNDQAPNQGCYRFRYSGCGGNHNNFLSETECRRACDVTRRVGH